MHDDDAIDDNDDDDNDDDNDDDDDDDRFATGKLQFYSTVVQRPELKLR